MHLSLTSLMVLSLLDSLVILEGIKKCLILAVQSDKGKVPSPDVQFLPVGTSNDGILDRSRNTTSKHNHARAK